MFVSDFNGMVCSSIDQAISDTLSIRVMESLYMYLRQNHKMTREEVPSHLDMFFSAMELVFGVMGTRTLGRIAARNLYARLNLKFDDRDGLTLSDYVDEAKDKNGLSADPKEFNDEVKRAVDGVIFGIVGREVLRALHKHLKDKYGINPDEIPYRLDTVFEILEHTFGVAGARTLGNAIARRLYFRYNLQFSETEGYKLQDYLEQAKRQLAEGVSSQASHD